MHKHKRWIDLFSLLTDCSAVGGDVHFFIVYLFFFVCSFIDYGQHTNKVSRLLATSMFLSIQHKLFHLLARRQKWLQSGLWKSPFCFPHFMWVPAASHPHWCHSTPWSAHTHTPAILIWFPTSSCDNVTFITVAVRQTRFQTVWKWKCVIVVMSLTRWPHVLVGFRKWRRSSITTSSYLSWRSRDMTASSVPSPGPGPCPSRTANTWMDVQFSSRQKSKKSRPPTL